MPPEADEKENQKKNIIARALIWIKFATTEWIPDHLAGGAGIADSIREDLGLRPGETSAAQAEKFKLLGDGIDPTKAGRAEALAQIADVAREFVTLGQSLETTGVTAGQASYAIMTLAATDMVRLRAPLLYALSRTILFFEDDPEQLIMFDPARILRSLRGENLPSGEAFAQRISGSGALILQLIDAFHSKDNDPRQPGHLDVFYGWDVSPDSVTPNADLVSLRSTTFSIGSASVSGGRLLATMLYVPREHGGPGLFLSLGGGITEVVEQENAKYRLDAAFGNVFDIYIPFGDGTLPLTAQAGAVNPFVKFGITSGKPDAPAFRFGDADGTRLDVYETEFGIEVTDQNASVHAALRNAEIIIVPGDGDSFLREVAGDGAKVRFSVGFIADDDGGFRLDGGTGVKATLTPGRSISGLLTVHHLEIALGPSSTGGDFGLELSGGFTAQIGPISATVDRIGFKLDADRRDNGNFGPFHLDLGFKAPNGIGLSLDAAFVRGGGYLYVDPANSEYAGALELTFGKFSLKAIGAITVKNDKWSLLLFVYGQFPPVQLGFGFTLDGVGGMIGVRHRVDLPALTAGMKTGAFDDILFPAHPVDDAPRILNRLRTLFPTSPASLTIGPMVDLGWGTPRIIFIRLAVLFQIDNVFESGDVKLTRIVLVGQLRVEIGKTKPDAKVSVVKLLVDILGYWDFEQQTYGFLAVLRDSKIAGINIGGGLGVWGDYGEHPKFLLAAGGFNPRFKDVPAAIDGAIPRLSAAFSINRFKLVLDGYFAITPGTVQFGVNLKAIAKIGPVDIKGDIGFDVLVYRTPSTHFIADFHVTVEILYHGHSLAGVKCVGTVEGPGLWRIQGKVTFSLLWWDIDKSFDDAWGTAPQIAETATDVRALLITELDRHENWSAQLPSSRDAMVTLAPRSGETATLAHPLGHFTFSQRVVPLGLAMERFDTAQVAGTRRFVVESFAIGNTTAVPVPVREQFARAQFVDVSEEDRLTRPSFEEMDAGVEFSSNTFTVGNAVANDMSYETAYLDLIPEQRNKTRLDFSLRQVALDHAFISRLAQTGCAARTPQRTDDAMRAKTSTILEVKIAPLAATDRTSFAADSAVSMKGQASTVSMIAEQRFSRADEQRSQLVEAFELTLV
ncbi:MAG: DUF6603 domain-containing protein [Gemmatimonadaceae bacterium]